MFSMAGGAVAASSVPNDFAPTPPGPFYVPEPRGIVVIGVADIRGDPESLWNELKGRLP